MQETSVLGDTDVMHVAVGAEHGHGLPLEALAKYRAVYSTDVEYKTHATIVK